MQEIGTPAWTNEVNALGLTTEHIVDRIRLLKDTAVGPDGISAKFLKRTIHWSSMVIFAILNRSLRYASVPRLHKKQNVLPLH